MTLLFHKLTLLLPKSSKTNKFLPLKRQFHKPATNATIFELSQGVGGSEAMLFAEEMLNIYMKYFSHMRWPFQVSELQKSGQTGGILSGKVVIQTPESFGLLLQEAGVHRVQRVPKTEKYGRMHTSTISVTVAPKSILDISINDRDVEMQTKRSSGPGGQHVNKTESAVRLTHKPSGVVVECQESRFQIDNRKIAMKKLVEKIRDIELEKLTSQSAILKKTQVASVNRNEKIRTYNFPQDRITDHRINKSYHNLRGFFNGDITVLERIIKDFH